ncbi:hypothetical protein [Streptomyces sp. Da 82-17]|uniref:hypothetical protein n=1 Tax=Streptomyces sp. Da 82-17 TaxID=3377116 RepID=UPI0038D393D1
MSPTGRPRLLYVTDLAYEARGRRYCDEDIFLSSRLRAESGFDVALCHPADAAALMDSFDLVLVRNSGPVLNYLDAYEEFKKRALASGTAVHNPLTGRADMAGKQYLLDLTAAGFPVIPTVDRAAHLDRLPDADEYVVKPALGADSIGLRVVPRAELGTLAPDLDGSGLLVQPRIPFAYEVSFYFVDADFQYALRTSDGGERWDLQRYEPTAADLEFARRFVAWNTLDHGIQRVDACRAPDGELLLVELEDLNPYLSLDLLPAATRDAFVTRTARSLRECLAAATR